MRATWNNQVIAESDATIVVENNHYFPREAVNDTVLRPSDSHSTCHWKGEASYFTIEVDGKTNKDAAWYYQNPSPRAHNIKGYVAFWKGVKVG